MDIETIGKVLLQNLEEYDRALSNIKQCAAAYERKCEALIAEIAECHSIDGSQKFFDELYEIQWKLSEIVFSRNIDIGSKLKEFTREFDRLHDPYIRDYWFKRFHSGQLWPNS